MKNTRKGESVIKAPISSTLQDNVVATKKAVFIDRWNRTQVDIDTNGDLITLNKPGQYQRSNYGESFSQRRKG